MVQQNQLGFVEKYGAAGELRCLNSSVNDGCIPICVLHVGDPLALLVANSRFSILS